MPLHHFSHPFSLILMITNRRVGRQREREGAGAAMWLVRLCHELRVIKIAACVVPTGF